MSVDPFYYPPSTGAGWSCGQCGAWVPYNTVHYCGAWRTSSVPPPTPPDRVADALERIAAALEKLAVIEGRA